LQCAPAAFAQNLLTNGSFETGDFTGWTTGGNFEDTTVESGAFYAYTGAQDGVYYAALGPVGSPGTLSQSFNDIPGADYSFSFWLAAVGDDPSSFSVKFDGTTLVSQTDPNTHGNWQQFVFNVTTTGHDTITFAFQDDPAYIALDNIAVVTYQTTIPEPSCLLLVGSGVMGLAGGIRRRLLRG
jgi:hypothetical protein